tara:strand:- start:301 stop:987 length:687 start_codon:yes stop_codon:yes gene_type:complete
MKKGIHNNWKEFLLELELSDENVFTGERKYSPSSLPFQVYCDMDGVLVDLIEGIIQNVQETVKITKPEEKEALMKILTSGREWSEFETSDEGKKALQYIFSLLGDDVDFWASLPAMPDAQQLWDFVNPLGCHILSAPWDDDSARGKRIWTSSLSGHLNPPPQQSRVVLTKQKDKYAKNLETGAPNVLIDDMDRYLGPWAAAGGIGIKHVSAANSIAELQKIIKDMGKE